jgi:DNA uptake protein ComE-like DNA-binding protein
MKIVFVLIIGLLAMAGLAACDSSSGTSAVATARPEAAATNTPAMGGAVGVTPTSLDHAPGFGQVTPTPADSIATETPAGASDTGGAGGAVQTSDCTKLNLNELTEAQLMATIPGFSSRMVREFLEYRPYASIQQFRQQIGKYVDATQVAEYEKYVYVPVDPNNSDAQTLMQLPGVDATVAAALANGRPYASNDAFLQALHASVSADQLAQEKCYLASNPN